MCLLSLASVSPQIHAWAFHDKGFADTTCPNTHAGCSKLPDSSGNHDSRQTPPENTDGICPVTLFDEGINYADEPVARFLVQSPIIALIAIRSDTVWTSHSDRKERARAPPIFR